MIVLSDEPKALVLAAERLMDLDSNIRRLFTIDTLAFQLASYIRQLRTDFTDNGSYIGTAGFMVLRFVDEDQNEEIRVLLDVTDFHTIPGEPCQQFHHSEGPWTYDESVPDEWRDDDATYPNGD